MGRTLILLSVVLLSMANAAWAASAAKLDPPSAGSAAALFKQAEDIRHSDQPQFKRILAQLTAQQPTLTPAQQWHLRYLNAWEDAYTGKPKQAAPALEVIIAQSQDQVLVTRSSALLINVFLRTQQYQKAYMQANTLIERIPHVKDKHVRLVAMQEIVSMLSNAGQFEQALSYIEQTKAEHVAGTSWCTTYANTVAAMINLHKIDADSAQLRQAIDVCLADHKMVFANTMRSDRAGLLIDAGKPQQALDLLQRIAPSIHRNGFKPHVAVLEATWAQAYFALGKTIQAQRHALAATHFVGYSWAQKTGYHVLYKLAKQGGDDGAALAWYEKYVALNKSAADDTKNRALAYQMVKQNVLAKKNSLEAMSKKNQILQLNQSLAAKSAETNRLYVVLLLLVLGFIVAWLIRVKQSQLRFRKLARHDGLTGACNRQHFLERARQLLDRLQANAGSACLVLLDLDYFKQVNDAHGHAAGDQVLMETVATCVCELRNSDIFGRLGGEEFGILMPSCTREQGMDITQRIRRAVSDLPITLKSGEQVHVSASFGLACTGSAGYQLAPLLATADAALYRAKDAGRNQLIVAEGNLESLLFIPSDCFANLKRDSRFRE